MDVRCVKCGEPWDIDSLHEHVITDKAELLLASKEYKQWGGFGPFYGSFENARKKFYAIGCEALGEPCGTPDPQAGAVVSALQELAGDDVDGLASDIEDAEALGLL